MTEPGQKVVDTRYAKSGDYQAVIGEIEEEGRCPFCPENFRYHKEPILKRRRGWFITRNSWPYENARHHFIILGSKHKEMISDLSGRDWRAINWLIRWAVREFDLPGGALTMRFGDTAHTGATVVHLHAHLIVPELDPQTGRARTVNFPIG